MSIFTVLMMRLMAWILVTYCSVSLDFATAMTSDPETVGAINVAVSAGVVMLTESISKRLGLTPAKLLMGLGTAWAKKLADKLTIKKAPEAPK